MAARLNGEWDWLAGSGLRLGCALVFARDVEEDEMFEAFELDPTSARIADWESDSDFRRVRVGRVGAWTFAIDSSMASLHMVVLPALHREFAAGRMSYSKIRELRAAAPPWSQRDLNEPDTFQVERWNRDVPPGTRATSNHRFRPGQGHPEDLGALRAVDRKAV